MWLIVPNNVQDPTKPKGATIINTDQIAHIYHCLQDSRLHYVITMSDGAVFQVWQRKDEKDGLYERLTAIILERIAG